ncbi:MAG: threonylcarbamoyladenosine tRNA methylthiotransferase MtaB [Candidatus Tokpelaia sp. JSC188]|nr:MAG: threonylcarbamoyladenosine tRNA methylthiotransferase MtaB [Candidatus Tokpelaia sp. JSC188]
MATKIFTFGCRLNAYETEIIRRKSKAAGLDTLQNGTIILNTCSVTAEAVRQAKQAIRRAKQEHPKAYIIVTGCAAQTSTQEFTDMDEIDLILGNEEKLYSYSYRQLTDFGVNRIKKVHVNNIMEIRANASHMILPIKNRKRAFVQIQNGCDHRCTFCIIPYGRGPSRSIAPSVVVEQIKRLCDNGYHEIVLTGIDLTSYGLDLFGKIALGKLISSILRDIPTLMRLRLSSIDSIEIDPELLDIIAYEKRLMPYLHLSLQAGDNIILKRMKRRHLREDAIRFCDELRKKRPEIVFGADLIAGFPTETDAMFERTHILVKECGLVHLHVFPFSPREGTSAALMPQVERRIVKQRAAVLRKAGDRAYANHLQKLQGTEQTILIERNGVGRCEDYTLAEINGSVDGTMVRCRITSHNRDRLIATKVNQHAA